MALPKGLRKISTHLALFRQQDEKTREAIVCRDVEWDEYRVLHYIDAAYQVDADYFTESKYDATSHAMAWIDS